MGYRITPLLPTRSYSRKNIGYLFAIQHGAEAIYETGMSFVLGRHQAAQRITDDDNMLLKDLTTFLPLLNDILVYHNSTSLVNPYAHFGQPSIWPRGYPLTEISVPSPTVFHVSKVLRFASSVSEDNFGRRLRFPFNKDLPMAILMLMPSSA